MPAPQRLRRPRAGRLVVLDLEHEPARPVAGQEVLDGLGALAALPVGADARAERDQRRAEIAFLRAETAGGAEVAADGGGRPHLEVADLLREAREQPIRPVGERRDRDHRADPDDVAVGAELVEPAAVQQQRASRA